jgi:tetratricopeptide (TPR) repeat protein
MKIYTHIAYTIVCIVSGSCASYVGAQNNSKPEQQLAVAVDHIADGNWAAAMDILKKISRTDLKQSETDRLTFTFGYFYQKLSLQEIDSTAAQGYLDSAATHYMLVLEHNPKNESVNQNLAVLSQQTNNLQKSVIYMKRAYRRNDKPEFAVSIGDLYRLTENYDSAFYFYKDALKKQPDLEQAHRGLVDLYSIKPVSAGETFAHCQQMMDLGYPKLSSIALSNYILQTYPSDTIECQSAFVWWMSLFGQDLVSDEKIARAFPIHWNFQGFKEIDTVWKNPMAIDKLEWWKKGSTYRIEKTVLVKREVITAALNMLGRRLLRDGKSEEGVLVYETAYDILTKGDPSEYLRTLNHQPPDIFLEVASNLGMSYVQYPNEKTKAKFERLENDLFDAKGGSLAAGDTEGAVKYHRTLGLIYATMGRWEYGVTGGFYQLEQAIRKSPVERNTAPLKELLLKGYLKTNAFQRASDLSLSTAMSYLNDDNLPSAERSLYRYDSLIGDKQAPIYIQLSAIINMRNKIATGIDLNAESLAKLSADIDRLTTSKSKLPDYFFKIQRFKMLSDAGTMASKSSDEKAAEFFHFRALKEAQTIETLSNLKDVSRLNDQQKTLKKSVKFEIEPEKLVPQNLQGRTSKEIKEWYVTMPGATKKQQVEMPESNFTAAKVLSVVNTHEEAPKATVEVINSHGSDVIVVPIQNNDASLKREIKKTIKQDQTTVKFRTNN